MEIKCSQCGASVGLSSESGFLNCPYCDSRLYVETDHSVQHYYLKPALQPEQIAGVISKELLKLELTQPTSIIESELVYVPFWLIKLKDQTLSFPASELELAELRNFTIPVGAMVPYEPELEQSARVEMPELGFEDLWRNPKMEKLRDEVLKSELVHIPFYRVVYTYQGLSYSALIDAGAGTMYADNLPASASQAKDRYFFKWFGLLSLIFFSEAFFIPKLWILVLAYLFTGGVAWYFLQQDLKRRGY